MFAWWEFWWQSNILTPKKKVPSRSILYVMQYKLKKYKTWKNEQNEQNKRQIDVWHEKIAIFYPFGHFHGHRVATKCKILFHLWWQFQILKENRKSTFHSIWQCQKVSFEFSRQKSKITNILDFSDKFLHLPKLDLKFAMFVHLEYIFTPDAKQTLAKHTLTWFFTLTESFRSLSVFLW